MFGSAAILMFIMTVAAANLCVGFAVAVYLGVGPRSWPPKFIEKWNAPEPAIDDSTDPATTETDPVAPPPPAAESTQPDAPEKEAHPFARSLEHFGRGFDRFESELADWDSRRRAEPPEADALANSAIELSGLAAGYLDEFEASLAPLTSLSGNDDSSKAAAKTFQGQADELIKQFHFVGAELESFTAAEAESAAATLTQTLSDLLAALHGARNGLEEPLAALLGKEAQENPIVEMLQDNHDTSLLGRLAFEHAWLAGEGYRLGDEVGSVAMIDVDNLKELNAAQGPLVVRRAIAAVGQIARESVGPAIAARLLGKQFAISLPDLSPPLAAERMEHIRQQLEQTRFQVGEQEFQLTVSTAVVSVRADDTASGAIERLRATIAEAKTCGRNRSFLWEGEAPTPVAPPQLDVEPRTARL